MLLLSAGLIGLLLIGSMSAGSGSSSKVLSLESRSGEMTAGGEAMIEASQNMDAAAALIERQADRNGDADLGELAQRWRNEAGALRDRGLELTLSIAADSMIHDPDAAHQLNPNNLSANGGIMVTEAQAMIEHGSDMHQQAAWLRESGVLLPDVTGQLAGSADALITAGEQLEREGEEMQDYAEQVLQSIGS
jgi:hypothetical protein